MVVPRKVEIDMIIAAQDNLRFTAPKFAFPLVYYLQSRAW